MKALLENPTKESKEHSRSEWPGGRAAGAASNDEHFALALWASEALL